MAEVHIEGVRKNFGKTEVLRGIDITIADGELLVILGPSGCGKSTLLRTIAGLEEITSGTIRIGDRIVNDLEPKDRDIAMVFQNYALYPHMKVYDNMAYGLRNLGTEQSEIERRVQEAARILGLSELLERKPRQLSGGQRQRVAMGRAIVREPAVFLFDEPLSNLDAKLRVQMRHEIKQLQERLRTTGVYVTHDQVEAMTLGDRLMILNGGQVEQIGTPIEVYTRPASTFVAGFIGSPAMNFLTGTIVENGVRFGDTTLPCGPVGVPVGGEVTLGIRPEHVGEDENGALHLQVEWIERLGADTIAHGRLADGQAFAARLAGEIRVTPGELRRFELRPDALHVFDPASGQRLGG